MKRIISILVALILSFSILFPTNFVEAVNTNYSNEIENSEYYSYNNVSLTNGEIPSKFDLRNRINIRVENQGVEGNCWAFASIKSLETYLSLHGYGDYDFSERHLAYLESEEFAKTESNIELFQGGFFWGFEDYVNNLRGPVYENEVPYNNRYSVEQYDYLLSLTPKAYVTQIVNFPYIDKESGKYTEQELLNYRNKIKQHIMKNGSLYSYVIAPQYVKAYYNMNTKASYIPKYEDRLLTFAHAVSIIGWDDNYSRDNFNPNNRPLKDGAYIALNSYGTGFGDNGVYYISYEDAMVELYLSGIEVATTNKEDVQVESVKFNDINLYNSFKNLIGSKVFYHDDNALVLKIRPEIIQSISEINFSNKGITDLTGIEKFENLTEINLSNNKIKDISILRNLNELYKLDVSNNEITNLYDFTNKEMNELNIANNKIQDISKISSLKYLFSLDISNNPISTKLDIFSNFIHISKLKLNGCNLTDADLEYIKNINACYNGLKLELKNNNLENVMALGQIAGLTILDLSDNKRIKLSTIPIVNELSLNDCDLTNIDELNMPKKTISIGNNQISNISKIINSNLKSINLSYMNIDDASIFANMKSLEKINLSGNKNITNLNTLNNLKEIELEDCNITNVEMLTHLNKLEKLNLKNNNIEEYKSLLQINNLRELDLSSNKIKTIYVDDEKYKVKVNLDNNQILNICNLPTYIQSIKNQNINISYENVNEISSLKETLSNIYENRYKQDLAINFENCQINYETKELQINTYEDSNISKVYIYGGKCDGYTCQINSTKEVRKPTIEYTSVNNVKYIINLNTENNEVSKVLIQDNFPDAKLANVLRKDGHLLESTDKLGTGTKIELMDANNQIYDTYTVAIKGDLDGDGYINIYDIVKLTELVFNEETANEWDMSEKIAGELDNYNTTENPDIYDVLRLIEYHFDGIKW